MGSRFFAHCDIDERFRLARRCPRFGGGLMWLLYDWDQRRCVDVHVGQEVDEKVVLKAVEQFMNDLPIGVVQVEISKEGTLLSSSSDPTKNSSWVPFYPPRTDFPRRVATVRRRDLTEVDRLGLEVDLMTYTPKRGETKQVVFKYYTTEECVARWWHEANCVMRMPRHPNIVPFDALVVDRIEDVDRVVGFTTHYVHGGTLSENSDRVFKLKYLEQLISVGALFLSLIPSAPRANHGAPFHRLSITLTSAWASFMVTYARGTFSSTLRPTTFCSSISILGPS